MSRHTQKFFYKRICIPVCGLLLFSPLHSCPADEIAENVTTKPLSLLQAIASTLENQRTVAIDKLQVVAQEGTAISSLGPFDPVVDAAINETISDDLQEPGTITNIPGSSTNAEIGLSKQFPIGTLISTKFSINKLDSILEDAPPLNLQNTAVLGFQLTQPFMRGLWWNDSNTNLISNTLLIESVGLSSLFDIGTQIATTAINYWELAANEEITAIRQDAVERAQSIVNLTRKLINNQEFAPSDLEQPLVQLSTQQAARERALQDVYASARALMLSIGADEEACRCRQGGVIPSSQYPIPYLGFDEGESPEILEALICYAVRNRTDIRSLEIVEESSKIQLKGALNQLLPEVNLITGITLTESVVGNRSKKFFSAADFHPSQKDWFVGVTISFPFYNFDAKGNAQNRSALLGQNRLQTEQVRQNAIQQIKVAWRNHKSLMLQHKYILETIKGLEKLVEDDKKRLQEGLSTLFVLIQYENDLTDSRIVETSLRKLLAQNAVNIRLLTSTLLTPDSDIVHIAVENTASLRFPQVVFDTVSKCTPSNETQRIGHGCR